VILENVKKAPWKKKEEIFEKLGYYAKATYVDTKHYYIPQTRQRGYLVAVLKNSGISSNVGQAWIDQIVALKRPTSASLDAFMFSNDDPRVLRGRARLTNGDDEDDNNHTNWAKCEVLHHLAREEEQLGDRRRFTGWSDTGNGTSLPGFAWNEWASKQVHRIHDLLEINTLRCAHDGMDPTMKTMIWDLSQNVGRDTMVSLVEFCINRCRPFDPSNVWF
jgi:site-specific DNA-cytosine methylase